MKNQYFGDIYDYIKYGLLRLLSGHGRTATAVCWMLTPSDGRPDGHRIQYLEQQSEWCSLDPVVYRFLQKQVTEHQVRNVRALESSHILRKCRFYSEILEDDASLRRQYLQRFLEFARGAPLVFFDPDNGMEVKSVSFGRKLSSKYLYWGEVESSYRAGHSLLVYQHLPPQPRDIFIRALAERFSVVTQARYVCSYRTKRVAFFLISQSAHEALFAQAADKVRKHWGQLLQIEEHG